MYHFYIRHKDDDKGIGVAAPIIYKTVAYGVFELLQDILPSNIVIEVYYKDKLVDKKCGRRKE
jgi:hypothetical protein